MTVQQRIAPNPNIGCTPGWCLVYVRQTFGVAATGRYPTAISNWNGSPYKHQDQNWPALWFPIWFTVNGNAAGHVALHAPDHSIYSSSSPTSNTPVHHPSLAAMQQYWGRGTMLNYVGWTYNVEDTLVLQDVVPAPAPVPTTNQGEEMIDHTTLDLLYRTILERPDGVSGDNGAVDHYVGNYTTAFVVKDLFDSAERATLLANKAAQQTALQTQVATLTQQLNDEEAKDVLDEQKIAELNQQITDLKATPPPVLAPPVPVPDATPPVVHATPPAPALSLLDVVLRFLRLKK